MVYAPGGIVPAIAGLALPPIPEFWIDKFEVTNAEFKAFVDAGGYRDRRWWKHEANRDGRPLAWVDAMRLFVDRTGRPGPATWEAGTYPAGRAEYPVTGVSWFEAAAFAEFSGKSLPTVYQFQYAGGPPNLRHDVRQGNFGSGPAAVSALRDLGPLGTYGLAGNVKEWVWNGVGDSASSPAEQHYIMGGGWNEPPYMGTAPDARPALDRADTNGIRLVRHIASPDAAGLANLRVLEEHTPPPIAVGDEAFDAYRRFYVYEQSPLDAKTESVSDTGDWTNEQVPIAAAYGNERIPITLLLPKNALPPYQTVIWCPGAYSLSLPESERMVMAYYFDFVVKSGRAVVMPDFQGFYSRRSETPAQARQPQREAFRDRVVQSAKDLNRTMDYLATRSDIDAAAVVYYVFSVGGATLAVPAMAPRLKGIIFLSAGLPRQPFPPEIDPVNFAPRLKTPVLFLGGRYDYLTPVESAQKALFDRLGTPEASKKHVIFESGHVPERIAVIREVLDWLDRTLGPVKTN
jgi:dienelactone hydrolase